jgi:fatty-acyl-CoA synthase
VSDRGHEARARRIEEYLYRHPKAQDVAVFGVPDARFGEQVAAWIRLREGATASAEEIRAFCQGQIAHYTVPAYIRFVDELPMTVTGKVQKFAMRAAMAAELGLSEAETG